MGEVFVTACDLQNGQIGLGLRNTTGSTVYGIEGYGRPAEVGVDAAQYSYAAPAGAEVIFAESDLQSFLLVGGDSADPTITHLVVHPELIRPTGCYFTAWWTQG